MLTAKGVNPKQDDPADVFAPHPPDWREHLRNVYSQFGEDGIIAEIFRRIGVTNRWCFEVGAADGKFMSNTRCLIEDGWNAVLIEKDAEQFRDLSALSGPNVKTINAAIAETGRTLESVLDGTGIPRNPDLGVIDIDGQDYYIWNSLINYRPRVMIIEYDPNVALLHVPDRGAPKGGAGFEAIHTLGLSRSYRLIAKTLCNMIFVVNEVVNLVAPPLTEHDDAPTAPAPDGTLRLNLGAGGCPLPNHINLDRNTGQEAYPLSYADGSASEIYVSHVLEHFSYLKTLDVLKEWVRVLKPGGTLRVAVPDFDWIVEHYQQAAGSHPPPLESYLMGGHVDENDHHGAIFNYQKLRGLMKLAGLRCIGRWKPEHKDCAALPVSLNIKGIKPHGAVDGISGVLSVGRLSFSDNFAAIMGSMYRLRFPMRIRQGVFWGQTMTVAIEQALTEPRAKYVLTIDGDTLFDHDDVLDLYELMEAHPEMDALCGMQIGRDRDALLMTIRANRIRNHAQVLRDDVQQDVLPISTGHFGLTLIRAGAFAKMAKPWFLHTPDQDGSWGDGRLDEDIYFWRNFESAGLKLGQANGVRLGHMQLVATWPDANLGPHHQYVKEWRESGRPAEADW